MSILSEYITKKRSNSAAKEKSNDKKKFNEYMTRRNADENSFGKIENEGLESYIQRRRSEVAARGTNIAPVGTQTLTPASASDGNLMRDARALALKIAAEKRTKQYESVKDRIDPEQAADTVKQIAFARNMPAGSAAQQMVARGNRLAEEKEKQDLINRIGKIAQYETNLGFPSAGNVSSELPGAGTSRFNLPVLDPSRSDSEIASQASKKGVAFIGADSNTKENIELAEENAKIAEKFGVSVEAVERARTKIAEEDASKKSDVELPGISRPFTEEEQLKLDIAGYEKELDALYSQRQKIIRTTRNKDEKDAVNKRIDNIKKKIAEAESKINSARSEQTEAKKKGGIADDLSYIAGSFGLGTADTIKNISGGIEMTIGDIAGNGAYSDGYKKIDEYFKNNDAEILVSRSLGAGRGKEGLAQEIAAATGVPSSVAKAYIESNEIDAMLEVLGKNVDSKLAKKAGEAAFSIGQQMPSILLTMGLPPKPKDAVKTIADRIAENISVATIGGSVYGSEIQNLARERGYNPANYMNALLHGTVSGVVEKAFGFSDTQSFKKLVAPTGDKTVTVLKAITNYLVSGPGGEGFEEAIEVPLSEVVDRMTGVSDRTNVFGEGGIIDIKRMVEAGVSGATVGAIMSVVGGMAAITDGVMESNNIRDAFLDIETTTKALPDAYKPKGKPRDIGQATMEDFLQYEAEVMKSVKQYADDYISGKVTDETNIEGDVYSKQLEALENAISSADITSADNAAQFIRAFSDAEGNGAVSLEKALDFINTEKRRMELLGSNTSDSRSVSEANINRINYTELARTIRNNKKDINAILERDAEPLKSEDVESVSENAVESVAPNAEVSAEVKSEAAEAPETAPAKGETEPVRGAADYDDLSTALGVELTGNAEEDARMLLDSYSGVRGAVDAMRRATGDISASGNGEQLAYIRSLDTEVRNANRAYAQKKANAYRAVLKNFGIKNVVVDESLALKYDGNDVRSDAFYDRKTGEIHISPYLDEDAALGSIIAHEFTHKGTQVDMSLVDVLIGARDKMISAGTYTSPERAVYEKAYADQTEGMSEADAKAYIDEEIAAHFMQDIMSKEDVLGALAREDRTVLQRILDMIRDFFDKGGKENRAAERVVQKIEAMLNNSTAAKTAGVEVGGSSANVKSVSVEDIKESKRFSLELDVEKSGDLIAVHNLSEEKLNKAFKLGGFPMPSVAIVRAKDGHTEFGDISVVFGKDVIDPRKNKANKVYSADAWTPSYPTVEYKANEAVEERITAKYYDLRKRFGADAVRPLSRYTGDLSDELTRNDGIEGIISKLRDDTDMMQLYLLDIGGEMIEPVVKETETVMSDDEQSMYRGFIDSLGEDIVTDVFAPEGVLPAEHRKQYISKNIDAIKDAYRDMLMNEFAYTAEEADAEMDGKKAMDYARFVVKAARFLRDGPKTVRTENDWPATREKIREATDTKKYETWLNDLFEGAVEKTGIRNQVDTFTRSGNRRSWDALHYENTLENVIRSMKASGQKGLGVLGDGNIFGAAATEYSSVSAIKKDASKRLKKVSQEEFAEMKRDFQNRLYDIASSLAKGDDYRSREDAMNILVEAVSKNKTAAGVDAYIRRESEGYANYSPEITSDLLSLVEDIRNMPTSYFEAKPQRAVSIDEISAFVVPDDIKTETRELIGSTNAQVVEYEHGNEQSRLSALNSLKDVRFSRELEDVAITGEDVEALRSIPYKNVNDFTSDDIKKNEKWARKFYQELGVKSPFFRAWFGDWRANDRSAVRVVEAKNTEYKAGKAHNSDMNRDISWGSDMKRETVNHAVKDKISINALNDIGEIVENSVYFNTVVSSNSSKTKMPNTAFMHSLYTLYKEGGNVYLLKLYVEEALSNNEKYVFSRAYELKDIEKVAEVTDGVHFKKEGLTDVTSATTYSVSELYSYVKRYDKDFSSSEASKVVNDDGTPKVMYHGSPNEFTVFDKKKSKPSNLYGRGFYFSDSDAHAQTYGSPYEVYLDVKNPLTPNGTTITEDQIRTFLEAVAENGDDYSIENYGTYDVDEILEGITSRDAFAVIQDVNATAIGDFAEAIELFNEVNGTKFDGIITNTETVVFKPDQIKSSTDNRGTFDKKNPDIRYSRELETEEETRDRKLDSLREYVEKRLDKKTADEWEKSASMTARKKFADDIVNEMPGVTKDAVTEALRDVWGTAENVKSSKGATAEGVLDELRVKARHAAEKLVDESVVTLVDPRYEEYKELFANLRGTPISVESARSGFDTEEAFEEWKKSLSETLDISEDGVDVIKVYNEWAEQYPEFLENTPGFSDAIKAGDRLLSLAKHTKVLSEKWKMNPYETVREQAVDTLEMRILAGFVENAEPTQSAKDKATINLLGGAAKLLEKDVKMLQREVKTLNRQIAILEKRIIGHSESLTLASEQRKYKKNLGRILAALNTPSRKKHIPDNIKGMVVEVLAELDNPKLSAAKRIDSERLNDILTAIKAKDPETITLKNVSGADEDASDVKIDDEVIKRLGQNVEQLNALKLSVESFDRARNSYEGTASEYNAEMRRKVIMLYQQANEVVKALSGYINQSNQVFIDGKIVETQEFVSEMISDLNAKKDVSGDDKMGFTAEVLRGVRAYARSLMYESVNPQQFFEMMGASGVRLANSFRTAQNKQQARNLRFVEFMTDLLGKNYDIYEVSGKKPGSRIEITIGESTIDVSRAQLMSLYCLWNRDAGRSHLEAQGAIFLTRRGEEKIERTFAINEEIFDSLMSHLTEKDIEVAKEIQNYLSTECAHYGNEASLQMYGYSMFGETHYFPIRVSSSVKLAHAKEWGAAAGQMNLEFSSFTNSVQPNSTSAIVIDDIFDVSENHAARMSAFSAYAPICHDLQYALKDGRLREAIVRAMGKEGERYLVDFLAAVNGNDSISKKSKEHPRSFAFFEVVGNLSKRAYVSANLSTVTKQYTSITRACAEIDTSYLIKAKRGISSKELYNEMTAHSGVAQIKALGYSDTAFGKSLREQWDNGFVRGGSIINSTEATRTIKRNYDKINDIAMRGTAKADERTWTVLWGACRAEILDKNPGIAYDELMSKTAERFNRLIGISQVVDSVMDTALFTRRVKGTGFGAFMNEGIRSYGQLLVAIDGVKNGRPGAKKKLAKTVSGILASTVILEPLISALFATLRDEKDDTDQFFRKVLKNLIGVDLTDDRAIDESIATLESVMTSEVFDGFMNLVPAIGQIYNLINDAWQGYSSSRIGVDELEKVVNTAKALNKASDSSMKTKTKATLEFIGAVSTVVGLPVDRVIRGTTAAVRNAIALTDNHWMQWELNKVFYNLSNGNALSQKNFYDIMKHTKNEGDAESYRKMFADLNTVIRETPSVVGVSNALEKLAKKGAVASEVGSEMWNIEVQSRFYLDDFVSGYKVENFLATVYNNAKRNGADYMKVYLDMPSSDGKFNIEHKPDGKYSYTKETKTEVVEGVPVQKTTYRIDEAGYEQCIHDIGLLSYQVLAELRSPSKSSAWNSLNAKQQVRAIELVYKYAQAKAKTDYDSSYDINGQGKWMTPLYANNAGRAAIASAVLEQAKTYGE